MSVHRERMMDALRSGRLREAKAEADALVRECPGDEAILLLCIAVWQALGMHARALSAIRVRLAAGDETAGFHEAAGVSCMGLRDLSGAVAHWRAALAITPGAPALMYRLAEALTHEGSWDEAEGILRRLLENVPHFSKAWCLLGRVLGVAEKREEALACYRNALRDDLRDQGILAEIGDAFAREGRYQDATVVFQRMLQGQPDNAIAWARLGAICQGAGLIQEAEQRYRRAAALAPGDIDIAVELGKVLVQRGATDEAETCFRRVLRMRPAYGPAQWALFALMEQTGRGQEAKAQIRAWQTAPNHPELLSLMARLAQTETECQEVRARIKARLSSPHLPKGMACGLHFAAGMLADKLGEYPDAFAHMMAGNRHRRHEKGYFRENTSRGFSEIKAIFTKAFLSDAPRARGHDRPLIFIVGMPRSGTSLAEQILTSHAQVDGIGESWELELIVRRRPQASGGCVPYPHSMASADVATLTQMATAYYQALPVDARNAACVTDKMPHNFEHIGAIRLLFPDARIVHCRRHPLDTTLSCFMQNFAEANGFSHDLTDCGFFYRQYASLMDHWRSVLDKPFFELQYETLVTDPEPTVRALLDYCGLSWDDACLRFHENKRVVHTASYQQVREPFYTRSIGRWRPYAAHLAPLVEELGDLVSEEDRAFVRTAAGKKERGQEETPAVAAG
ncbi:sulfotransferase [Acidiferrobacter sp.]|uniref:tetratricopeptide repeat-containing sulfotransferase family protein n=1 Tax=Acidiferrobacter sp. TaxID=1872107 RepID=UPI0026292D4D|nr:sulfotransferase [Acidiferrobacter sp.]